MGKKQRVDQLLVDLGLYSSRERAKRSIMAGLVTARHYPSLKPGLMLDSDTVFSVKEKERVVSRGGYKLQGAIDGFDLCLDGKIAIDAGASTGGFTDCLLQAGVKKVYAVDVGKGLIDWSLRNNDKVILIEETNARYLKEEDIGEKVDLITIDVSFISLKKVVPALIPILKKGGYLLSLVKPQFEAGRGKVGKNGVVRDEKLICQILDDMIDFFSALGLEVNGKIRSPIKGPAGNKEYLLWSIKI